MDPKAEMCCTWTCISTLQKLRILNFNPNGKEPEDYCGWDLKFKARRNQSLCCHGMDDDYRYPGGTRMTDPTTGKKFIRDCDAYQQPLGPAFKSIVEYSMNITAFYEDFTVAWDWAT